jgi:hypothetical protein
VNEIASAHPEVEFALVLARTIDSVKSDPEQLRSAIYELARQKLQQLSDDDPAEKARLMHALEVAIAGVEGHMKGSAIEKFPVPSATALLPGAVPEMLASPVMGGVIGGAAQGAGRRSRHAWDIEGQAVRKRLRFVSSTAFRFVAMLAFLAAVAAVVVAHRHGTDIASFRAAVARLFANPQLKPSSVAQAASQTPAQAPASPDAEPKRLLPTAYGVYAENGGKLHELTMLQGRAPDPRVAISAAILHPTDTVLADGHVKFVVFRTGSDNGSADAIEVRLIARVKQATSFDPAGKPVVSSEEESWVIRNISIPYRASPIKDEPRMYEVEPRDGDMELSPGRYALVIKGQAFDFAVNGTVTDKRHCLERIAAANGTFYSECPNP